MRPTGANFLTTSRSPRSSLLGSAADCGDNRTGTGTTAGRRRAWYRENGRRLRQIRLSHGERGHPALRLREIGCHRGGHDVGRSREAINYAREITASTHLPFLLINGPVVKGENGPATLHALVGRNAARVMTEKRQQPIVPTE